MVSFGLEVEGNHAHSLGGNVANSPVHRLGWMVAAVQPRFWKRPAGDASVGAFDDDCLYWARHYCCGAGFRSFGPALYRQELECANTSQRRPRTDPNRALCRRPASHLLGLDACDVGYGD